ncbi:MAG: iron-sulfur cluster assembly accessory protein [Alphaproteobacteria bacterium TMED93]|nr:MAG: iron-sulfur cluster assembly accessory protein [Alphaproteobacteria bacterium TMED93]
MNKIDNLNYKKLEVSLNALKQMEKILSSEEEGCFVRLSVDSGGCSGFSYKFSIDKSYDKLNDVNLIKEKESLVFVTDAISLKFIENSIIDWKEDLSSAQFVIENPLAKAKCGCGTSFSI